MLRLERIAELEKELARLRATAPESDIMTVKRFLMNYNHNFDFSEWGQNVIDASYQKVVCPGDYRPDVCVTVVVETHTNQIKVTWSLTDVHEESHVEVSLRRDSNWLAVRYDDPTEELLAGLQPFERGFIRSIADACDDYGQWCDLFYTDFEGTAEF